jgi:diguanylate cyclase (GGDEF)-like protein
VRRFSGSEEHAALYDSQTGLYGKALFEILGSELIEQARRYGPPLNLALYRLEWLEQAPAEPEVVKEVLHYVGLLLVENLRQCDIAAHLGGGLFAALLPHTPFETAKEVSERMCKTIIGSPVLLRSGEQLQVMCYVGAAPYEKGQLGLEELMEGAQRQIEEAIQSWVPPVATNL